MIQTGGPDGEAVAALNKKDGSVIWKAGTGKVEAQIPLVAELAGRRQILASSATKIFGLDIETGRILWEADQSEKLGYEQITLAGPEHLLLTHDRGSVYYRIHSTKGRVSLQQLWESREFRANGLNPRIPVYLNGHFYAHTGPFLSCIEAETGRRVWRSRPPGGQSLILVADRLMMVGSEGHLVAVSAQSDGYREEASLKVFEQHRVYTPPSFSEGRLFVRDLTHLAAVEVRPADSVPLAADDRRSNPAGRLPRQIVQVEDAQDKDRAIEELLRRPGGFPVVEEGWAHFVFQGDVADLAIRGDLTGYWPEIPMHRLEGTNLFYASFPTDGAQRFQYRFQVFDEDRLDPLNPRRIETADGHFSVWQSEAWSAPDFLTRSPSQRGRLDEVEVVSRRNGRSYAMSVYTPARAVDAGESLPLVLVAQGSEAVEKGRWVTALDNLYQDEALPDMIVAFIKLPESAWYTASLQRLEQILFEDYLPYLQQNYPLADDPERRAIVAQGNSATNMLWLAATNPRLSSRIALQSPYMYRDYRSRRWPEILHSEHLKQVRIAWGSHDGRNPVEDVDVARDASALAERLRAAGIQVDAAQSPGGWGWALWSSQMRDVLIGLFQD